MIVGSRWATSDDIADLVGMYPAFEAEQGALRAMWPLADGIAAPVADSLRAAIDDTEILVGVGTIDDIVFGFIHVTVDDLLPQADGVRVGVIRHIYVEPDARGVGVAESMIGLALDELRARGITRFDARVSPGHRNAKNFFEANGFSARLIVMHNPGP
ncbi:MAG: GNAT family N-acetyltransferase [Acidimicrobiia bacterium]|nr:GNAT family N-acetyltransferase [Acidimicrobiia bacterium]